MKTFCCILCITCMIGAFPVAPVCAGNLGSVWYPYNGTHWEPGTDTAKNNLDASGNLTVPVPGEATWSLGPGWAVLTGLPDVDGLPYAVWAVNEALNWWADVSGFTNLGLTNGTQAPFGAPNSLGKDMGDIRFGLGEDATGYVPGLHDLLEIPPPDPPGKIALALTNNPNTEENCPDCVAQFGVPGTLGGDIRFGGYNAVYRRWVDAPEAQFGNGQYDFFTVVLHEVGHALGLDHPYADNMARPVEYTEHPSLMEMYYQRGEAMRALSKEDIQHIQDLYGPGDFTPASELCDAYQYVGPNKNPGMIYHERYTGPRDWGVMRTVVNFENRVLLNFQGSDPLTVTITNRTRQTWTGLYLNVESLSTSAGFVGAVPYDGPGAATLSDDGRSLDIKDLALSYGETFTFTVNADSGGPGVRAVLYGQPIVYSGDFDQNGIVDCSDYDILMTEVQKLAQPASIDGHVKINYSQEMGNLISINYTTEDIVKIASVSFDFTGKNVIYNPDGEPNTGDEIQSFYFPEKNGAIENIIWGLNLDPLSTGTGTPLRADYLGGKVTIEIIDGTTVDVYFNPADSEALAQEFFGAAARFSIDIPDFKVPSDPAYDLNEDGIVDDTDLIVLYELFDDPSQVPCDRPAVLPGDVDGNGQVGTEQDMAAFEDAFGSNETDPEFNPNADLDGNGRVNVDDLKLFRQILQED